MSIRIKLPLTMGMPAATLLSVCWLTSTISRQQRQLAPEAMRRSHTLTADLIPLVGVRHMVAIDGIPRSLPFQVHNLYADFFGISFDRTPALQGSVQVTLDRNKPSRIA